MPTWVMCQADANWLSHGRRQAQGPSYKDSCPARCLSLNDRSPQGRCVQGPGAGAGVETTQVRHYGDEAGNRSRKAGALEREVWQTVREGVSTGLREPAFGDPGLRLGGHDRSPGPVPLEQTQT